MRMLILIIINKIIDSDELFFIFLINSFLFGNYIFKIYLYFLSLKILFKWGLGIGDWGLGIGD